MELFDKIILSLYFPLYQSSEKSRFEQFFKKLNKKNNNSKKVTYNIVPEKIGQNLDKRTSIVLKNIPNAFTKKEIEQLLYSFGNINFLRIFPDKNNILTSSVYINFINYKSILKFYMTLRKIDFRNFTKLNNVEIFYSKIQGKKELLKEFVNKI